MTADSEQQAAAKSDPLSEAEIIRARLLVGVDVVSTARHPVTMATEDAIFNFTQACGSDNPLHCNPLYGAATRWGSVIAPTIMGGLISKPLRGDPLSESLKTQTAGLFENCHAFVSGGEWTFFRPILIGDVLYSFESDESVEIKPSRFSGRSAHLVRARVKINQRGEVVAVYKVRRIISPRRPEKGDKIPVTLPSYSDADIARFDAISAAEQVRGAEKRWFEDVNVGDSLGEMIKGPLTATDIVAFLAGGGFGFASRVALVGRLAVRDRHEHPKFYSRNTMGAPDILQRVHWDPELATSLGHPAAFDYGVMRESYLFHYLTDWCGDDGWVVRLYDEMRKFNYVGDRQLIRGTVSGLRRDGKLNLVEVKISMVNQRDEETVKAEATIALPSRETGADVLPNVPSDLEQRAAKIWSRHNELSKSTTA